MNKNVIAYTGGQGSGKTYQVMMYAKTRGIQFTAVLWPSLKQVVPELWSRYVHNGHLFLEAYDINDAAANQKLHELASLGIKVLCSCSQDSTPEIPLPYSFLVIKCAFPYGPPKFMKEVKYG
jgi:hypothetical protein